MSRPQGTFPAPRRSALKWSAEDNMNRRGFLLGLMGAAVGGAAIASQAQAQERGLWDELNDLEAVDATEDLPAEGAEEAQHRRSRGRRGGRRRGGRRYYGRRRYRRGRPYWRYRRPRRYYRRRRVCRLVRNRYGRLIRRCWWR